MSTRRERTTPLTPEFAARAMKDRGLFYHDLVVNLDKEIAKNNPDSATLRKARTYFENRAIGLAEAVAMMAGREYELPEARFESYKWLGDIIEKYSQEKSQKPK
jgi:hypothetical protein